MTISLSTETSSVEPRVVELVTDRWTVALGLQSVPRDAGGHVLADMKKVIGAVLKVPRDAGGEVIRAVGAELGATHYEQAL